MGLIVLGLIDMVETTQCENHLGIVQSKFIVFDYVHFFMCADGLILCEWLTYQVNSYYNV